MDARKVLEQLAQRMEMLLSKEADPQPAMAEILNAAESAELIDAPGAIRRDNPRLFVMDLLTENPSAKEWAESAKEWLRPLSISSLPELLDEIRPV